MEQSLCYVKTTQVQNITLFYYRKEKKETDIGRFAF